MILKLEKFLPNNYTFAEKCCIFVVLKINSNNQKKQSYENNYTRD